MSGKRDISTDTSAHQCFSCSPDIHPCTLPRNRREYTQKAQNCNARVKKNQNKTNKKSRMRNIGKNKTEYTQKVVKTEFHDIQRTEDYQTGDEGGG